MLNPFLLGQKVYLRPLEREDALTLQPWFNDPEVNRYMLIHRPLTRQTEEQFIDRVNNSEHELVMMIVRIDVDMPIGTTGFHQINFKNRNAMFGISIGDKEVWGQGFGTEAMFLMLQYAFDTLNLHRVGLQVFEYNERAIRVYEKLGFRQEGVLRQEHYREGRYWDTMFMGLLREEWRALWNVADATPTT
jgi:UDP-4-amino-4,6-dideoxy-N-acetyl-beta-L-altrosamine N-acetyltransferase